MKPVWSMPVLIRREPGESGDQVVGREARRRKHNGYGHQRHDGAKRDGFDGCPFRGVKEQRHRDHGKARPYR
jgi:hypothetical protein